MTENWRCAAVVSAPLSLVPIIRNVNIPASSGSRAERKMATGKALNSWVSILKLGWPWSVSQAVSDPMSEWAAVRKDGRASGRERGGQYGNIRVDDVTVN